MFIIIYNLPETNEINIVGSPTNQYLFKNSISALPVTFTGSYSIPSPAFGYFGAVTVAIAELSGTPGPFVLSLFQSGTPVP